MPLFDFFNKGNKNLPSNSQEAKDALVTVIEPRSDPLPQSFELTLQDAASGRSFTGTFFRGCTVYAALSKAKNEGILSIPSSQLWLFSQNGKKLSNSLDPRVEPEVHPGATLIIDLMMRDDPRFCLPSVQQNLRKAYPLVFFRKENGACIERIDFTCYGYEDPFEILQRMHNAKLLNRSHAFDILHWPTQKKPNERFASAQYLCEFDPEPGRVFIIEDEGMPMEVLYGCPPAQLPNQMHTLRSRNVDVISYE